MSKLLVLAAYAVYAAFWIRFIMHTLLWAGAMRGLGSASPGGFTAWTQVLTKTALDVLFLGRLLRVNPALWFGEWSFHVGFLLVALRHLQYFLNPVPSWVWWAQTPGSIAGYLLPFALVYILVIRLFTKHEKYASPANMLLLGLVLVTSTIGVLMHFLFNPNLVDAKLFIFGLLTLAPVAPPDSLLFTAHFILFLVLVLLLPSHIFTAPFVMFEARKREQALRGVMHEELRK